MQTSIPDNWEDEPPVEAPDSWYGGRVEHTGGNIWCRVWRTVKNRTEADTDRYHEVGYDGQFRGASLSRYVADEDYRFVFDENIEDRDASEQTDGACAEVALELMRQFE